MEAKESVQVEIVASVEGLWKLAWPQAAGFEVAKVSEMMNHL
jgi:hypothetical protein